MRGRALEKVLLIEDNPGDARLFREMLRDQTSHDTQLTHLDCVLDAEGYLAANDVDIVLLDLALPDAEGLEAVQRIHSAAPRTPLVVLTGRDEEDLAILAMQEGAQDYLVKGQLETRTLMRTLRYAVERKHLEDRYRSLMEEANDAILVLLLPSLEIVEANRHAEALFGCPRAEIIGRSYEAFVPPEDRVLVAVDQAVLLAAGSSRVQDRRLLRPDGTVVVVDVSASRVRNGEEAIAIKILHDTTERKKAERRLLESAEEYRLLFDCAPHPIWVFDVVTLAFLAVNDAAVELYGYSRSEFMEMTIQEIRPPEDVQPLCEYLDAIPKTPSLAAVHIKHRKKDGTFLEVVGVSNPIEFRGRSARLVMANDISEKKFLEAQLSHAQKMEVVGRLAGGVAHDFNNLLGVIAGYSELVLENLGPEHSETHGVEQIQRAAERAAGLTRQLLAFSRKQVLQPRVLELDEVVAGIAKMLRRLIGEDIQLVTQASAGLGRIRADPGQIEQILMNLVVNARDAMPKGGRVLLETSNVVLDDAYAMAHPEVRPGPFVMMSVSDTGVGMGAETLAHLFEPFFTTKEAGKGTGLGLATVFGIVQQSGASVCVESRLGSGTTFKIYFPQVWDEVQIPAAAAPLARPPRGTESILLVEDSEMLRALIRRILLASGFAVVDCANPEEALAMATSSDTAIDLMLTDVVMPGMSGPDLARGVQLARPEVRVLFMSGYTDEAMGVHGVLAEGTQFIQKPFVADALRRKVREALEEPYPTRWEAAPAASRRSAQGRAT